MVDGIVERLGIKRVLANIAGKVLRVGGLDLTGFDESRRELSEHATASLIERTQCFTTSDFTMGEEVGLPNSGDAPGNASGPLGESFEGVLDDIDAVKVESLDRPQPPPPGQRNFWT